MKIGIAQINTTVGDLEGNRALVIDAYRKLSETGAELVVFPELVVCGYPPRDLLLKSRFVADNIASLQAIAAASGEVPLIAGFVARNESGKGRSFYNAAAWCAEGAVAAVAHKCLLPTYDVFDEDRYFQSAEQPCIVEFRGLKFGLTICEDIWTHASLGTKALYHHDPLESLAARGIDFLINVSASPWHYGKSPVRESLVTNAARKCGCPAIYCNAVGGNDELVFDGHSVAATPDGRIVTALAGFREELCLFDTESQEPVISPQYRQDEAAEIHDALVLGLRDYAHKSRFHKALLGLSGGIDSSVTAVLAVEALGADNVMGISLPSRISSEHSKSDAAALAANLGIDYRDLPIADVVAAAESSLAPLFAGLPTDVTEENLQARSRGLLLMAVSNKLGALLLTTGNKSELAVGYCTLYGDMCGGLAVISDLPKVKVYELARWINRSREIIPVNSIDKPPSAELRPDQMDEDSLPPYEILDAILEMYVENGRSRAEIIAAGFDEAVVNDIIRKVDLNEYKRKQAAPGLKITPLAFGVGRRIPIVQRYVS
jgi:NAD+ synthase (glutamine-hydrolysing)